MTTASADISPRDTPHAEGARLMQVCNACRYCEGYCAVFPAMERRIDFAAGDLNYLANLCHGCGECFYACQFAPPHEFAVNVPVTMAAIRTESYKQYAWPAAFARAYDRNGVAVAAVLVLALAAFMLGAIAWFGAAGLTGYRAGDGNFYALMPHGVMAGLFGALGLYVVLAFAIGFMRFARDGGEPLGRIAGAGTFGEALRDAVSLTYLSSGGQGCTFPGERHSQARRHAHHVTFWGFMLCFAATCVATLYHYGFGWVAPYSPASLPVLLGTAGGVALLIGPATLLWLKGRQDPATRTAAAPMDRAFIGLLMLTAATGLALLALRGTSWLGFWLVVHLAIVMALFLTLPYGKFVHGLYRLGALMRYAVERRKPALDLGGD